MEKAVKSIVFAESVSHMSIETFKNYLQTERGEGHCPGLLSERTGAKAVSFVKISVPKG